MKLRSSLFVTAFVTAIVTTAASIMTPASAEILTVCASSTQSFATPEPLPPSRFVGALIPLSGQVRVEGNALIALWRDDDGFDILLNWGGSDQQSLRAEGAQVIGAAQGSELVHLMVAYADGALEHFLFDLDDNGAGELLRSAAPETRAASPSESVATCLKPR